MTLIWSEGAMSDWQGIARYIAIEFGKKAFDDFSKATDAAEKQITQFPSSGTPFETRKHKELGLRFVLIHRLSKLIYHEDNDTIVIDVVWDVRQSPKRLAGRIANLPV